MSRPKFEILIPEGIDAPGDVPGCVLASVHRSLEDLLSHGDPGSAAILIGGFGPGETLRLVGGIRSTSILSSHLIYVDGEPGGFLRPLVDGTWPSWSRLVECIVPHIELRALVPSASTDPEELLLRWLFVRPDGVVLPVVDAARPSLYSWPLLDALLPGGMDVLSWKESLLARGLLRERRLLDRIRLCPSCKSGHLVFQERCPSCQAIDLQAERFVHCFPCGAVGTLAEFRDPDGLRCPKCRSVLRHIGSDYDHPLDTQRCRSCGNVFGQASVVASCLDCASVSAPGTLASTDIAELEITDAGRMAVRDGTLRDIHAVFDKERYAPASQFEQNLQWMCDLVSRYGAPAFSVLQLRIRNARELADRLGRPAMVVRLEEFARRLRSIIRDTDIPTRLREDQITILMPATESARARTAIDRLGRVSEQVDLGDGDDRLEIEWALESPSEDGGHRKGATAILAGLSAISGGMVRPR